MLQTLHSATSQRCFSDLTLNRGGALFCWVHKRNGHVLPCEVVHVTHALKLSKEHSHFQSCETKCGGVVNIVKHDPTVRISTQAGCTRSTEIVPNWS